MRAHSPEDGVIGSRLSMQSLIHDFLYHAIWGQRDADARPVPSLVLHPDEGTLYWCPHPNSPRGFRDIYCFRF